MAAAALAQRELAASKLEEAVRQIKRSIQTGSTSKAIIERRVEKIESEKDELIEIHHRYAEKSSTAISDQVMKDFILPKLDAAEDVLLEAFEYIDTLNANVSMRNKQTDLKSVMSKASSDEDILYYVINEASKILSNDSPTNDDVIKVQNFINELEKNEEAVEKSFGAVREVLLNDDEIEAFSKRHLAYKRALSDSYADMRLFAEKNSKEPRIVKSEFSERRSAKPPMRLAKTTPPKFDNSIRSFARFKADFEAIVKPEIDDELYLIYVLKDSCLSGTAYDLVKNLDTEEEIWQRLEEKYGDAIEVVDSVIQELQQLSINRNEQDRGVIELVDVLEKGVRDLTAIGERKQIANAYTVKLLVQKLPRRVKMKWFEEELAHGDIDRFEAMFSFLKAERKKLERLIQQSNPIDKEKKDKSRDTKEKHVSNAAEGRDGDRKKDSKFCIIHKGSNHLTRKCKDFVKKTYEERDTLVKDLGACRFCLSLSHVGESCPWESKWDPCDVNECGQLHARLLHPPPNTSCKVNSNTDGGTLLLVQAAKAGKKDITIFWDNGSDISFVKNEYALANNLCGKEVSYELETLNGTTPHRTTLFTVPITDTGGKNHSIEAYGIGKICGGRQHMDYERLRGVFDDLNVDDVRRNHRDVHLLIGSDYAELQPKRIQVRDKLVLYESRFGTGKLLAGRSHLVSGDIYRSSFVKTVAAATSIKIEVIKPRTEVDFFTAEEFGVKVPPKCKRCKNCKDCSFEVNQLSLCEQRELEIMRDNLTLDTDENKWSTPYPYLKDPAKLKPNRDQAVAFLKKLEKRLEKQPEVKEQYCKQFQELIDLGIYKELSEGEMRLYDGPVFYITHHEVFKEGSSSTPVRIVLNSSLKNKDGECFNDYLMKGPNTLNPISNVQLKFRTYPVACVGDVSKMYPSISTTIKERHLRRVLWRGMKLDEPIKTYGTETLMFGDKPAAAISSIAITETAERYKHIDEIAAQRIKEDRYVDDITTGGSDIPSTKKLITNMEEILSKGKFKVKGFVMSGDSSKEKKALLGSGKVGRVLGTGWDSETDEFIIIVRINISKKVKGARTEPDLCAEDLDCFADRKVTRRILLSIVYSCYDPFGLVSPITIQLKIELRYLYSKQLNLTWDGDIPHELKLRWVKLLKLLMSIDGIRFKRCVHEPNARGDPELIIFGDGSPLAMCAAAYIRWELQDGTYTSHLFAAKTRVTPLERVTIPRVEMQSAVMGVRVGNSIMKSTDYNFKNVTYITDSTCTIATLKKESVALKEYMGNMVAEICGSAKPSQFYHVSSADNIADLGTRMEATADDMKSGAWPYGPAFIRTDRKYWPVTQEVDDADVPEDEVIKKSVCYYAVKVEPIVDIKKFRSFSFLMGVTARIYSIFERKSFAIKEVTTSSLKKAERYWIQQSMEQYTKPALEKGRLLSLRPQVNEEGVIALASRAVEGLKLHYNADSFPILTEKDPLAVLWMREVHEEEHSGATKTAAKSRRKFWIIRGRKLATKIRYSCYDCRRLDKKLASQLMSPLPLFRQGVSPVFNVTSIDLFGPFQVKDMVKKRTKMKVWGLIATCASTRAIHIDVADGYSTDAVLQSLRKFVALRGCPSKIISDPGSQLKSASKNTQVWDWSNVKRWAANNKIEWEPVPADSQHMNGLSESLIRSVKRSIEHVIGDNVLSFSELQLMFYEIANIINSRPIGVISGADPDCPNPITPNDLILGRSTNGVPQGPFETNPTITRRFLFVQRLIDDWWSSWYDSVLPSLVPSYKWRQKCRNARIGDICLIRYKGIRATYRLGRVIGVHAGKDGLVRRIKLEYKLPNEKSFRTVERSVHGVAVIVPVEEQGESEKLEAKN